MAPKRPVIKRKKVKMADSRRERDNQRAPFGDTKREMTRTGIGGERHHQGEDEETGERPQVYRIPT